MAKQYKGKQHAAEGGANMHVYPDHPYNEEGIHSVKLYHFAKSSLPHQNVWVWDKGAILELENWLSNIKRIIEGDKWRELSKVKLITSNHAKANVSEVKNIARTRWVRINFNQKQHGIDLSTVECGWWWSVDDLACLVQFLHDDVYSHIKGR